MTTPENEYQKICYDELNASIKFITKAHVNKFTSIILCHGFRGTFILCFRIFIVALLSPFFGNLCGRLELI